MGGRVTSSNMAAVRSFLVEHLETSVFLLCCLDTYGPIRAEHRDSGNYRCIEERGEIVAVASSTRRGHLLLQTGGRSDLGAEVLADYAEDPTRIDGVVAEWQAAQSVWPALRTRSGFVPTHETRHLTYRIHVDEARRIDVSPRRLCRPLDADDFEIWYPLFNALEVQEGARIHGPREEVRERFVRAPSRWRGAFEGPELAAVACLDSAAEGVGHVGGVFVQPTYRGRGLVRTLLAALAGHGQESRGLSTLVLFAREENVLARRLYEGTGFVPVGSFGFLLGTWT